MVVGIGVFGVVLAHAVWFAPEAEAPAAQTASAAHSASASAPSGQPSRLSIPALGIDAKVQHVGISSAGNVMVPSNFTDVAWYKWGPAPGEPGTAIIDGHVDNGLSLAGVFKRLDQIQTGDDIDVVTASGTKLAFVVTGIQSYPYQQVPMAAITAPKRDAELALITCDGGWVQGQRTYDHRLVVYAKLE